MRKIIIYNTFARDAEPYEYYARQLEAAVKRKDRNQASQLLDDLRRNGINEEGNPALRRAAVEARFFVQAPAVFHGRDLAPEMATMAGYRAGMTGQPRNNPYGGGEAGKNWERSYNQGRERLEALLRAGGQSHQGAVRDAILSGMEGNEQGKRRLLALIGSAFKEQGKTKADLKAALDRDGSVDQKYYESAYAGYDLEPHQRRALIRAKDTRDLVGSKEDVAYGEGYHSTQRGNPYSDPAQAQAWERGRKARELAGKLKSNYYKGEYGPGGPGMKRNVKFVRDDKVEALARKLYEASRQRSPKPAWNEASLTVKEEWKNNARLQLEASAGARDCRDTSAYGYSGFQHGQDVSTPKSFWSYQSSTTTPSLEEAIRAGVIAPNTTKEQWEQMSPGMRREIMRGKTKDYKSERGYVGRIFGPNGALWAKSEPRISERSAKTWVQEQIEKFVREGKRVTSQVALESFDPAYAHA